MSDAAGADFSPIVKSLAIIPKVTGTLSILGSSYIVYYICRDRRRRRRTFHRLLVGLSAADIVSSFTTFLGTWPIPRGTPGVYAAVGTVASCETVGFFAVMAGPGQSLYMAALGVFYVMSICWRWSEERMRRFETAAHVVIWTMAVAFAAAALAMHLLNNADNWVCWIAEQPLGCGPDTYPCERGEGAWRYQWSFYFVWGYLSFVVLVLCLVRVYVYVRRIEKAGDVYKSTRFSTATNGKSRSASVSLPIPDDRPANASSSRASTTTDTTGRNSNSGAKSRAVLVRGVLYGLAWMSTWIWTTVARAINRANPGTYYNEISFLIAFFLPLQGWWNFLIYIRPDFTSYRKNHPDESFFVASFRFLFTSRSGETKGDRQQPIERGGRGSGVRASLSSLLQIRRSRASRTSEAEDSRRGSQESGGRSDDIKDGADDLFVDQEQVP